MFLETVSCDIAGAITSTVAVFPMILCCGGSVARVAVGVVTCRQDIAIIISAVQSVDRKLM